MYQHPARLAAPAPLLRLFTPAGRVTGRPHERTWSLEAELVVMIRGVFALFATLRDPAYRALVVRVVFLFTAGTIFYSLNEGWSVLDALWFSVATLLTASFADLFPTTAESKIFTMVYAVVGVGVLVSFLAAVGRSAAERWFDRAESHRRDSGRE